MPVTCMVVKCPQHRIGDHCGRENENGRSIMLEAPYGSCAFYSDYQKRKSEERKEKVRIAKMTGKTITDDWEPSEEDWIKNRE